jgi:SlyX protein
MDTSPARPALIGNEQPMPTIEQRLTDLEIKASFTEDAVDQLNAVIVRQQRQIDALLAELATLRQQLPDDGTTRGFRSLRDELPPHY